MNLKLYRKIEELLNRIYPMLVNFPKAEKYSLCSEIKGTFYNLLQYIARANYVKSKRLNYLQEAEGYLTQLRLLIKLSFNLKYISKGAYKDLDESLTEISKMLAGYIKQTIKPKESRA